MTQGLNNLHPTLEINDNLMVFNNSFNKPTLGVYHKENFNHFSVRLGVVYGYKKLNYYNGKVYRMDLVDNNKIMPMIVPSYENRNFLISVMGEAVAAGFKVEF